MSVAIIGNEVDNAKECDDYKYDYIEAWEATILNFGWCLYKSDKLLYSFGNRIILFLR